MKISREVSIVIDALSEFGLISPERLAVTRFAIEEGLRRIRSEKFHETHKNSLIYDKIKAICEEKSLSIRQVEVAAGLKNGAISKWNDSSPTVKSLKAVADVLKVKVDKLIS